MLEYDPPKINVANCVVTAEWERLSWLRVLCSFQVPWSNLRHFFLFPHNKMLPSWRTIEESSIPSGRLFRCLVPRSPNMTSTVLMDCILPGPPATIIQDIFSKKESNWYHKQYIQCFNSSSFFDIVFKKNIYNWMRNVYRNLF